MMEPEISGTGYQEGLRRRVQEQNLCWAVKARDQYTCQLCGRRKKPWALRDRGWRVEEAYGYQTAVWREELGLVKGHTQDGLAMLMRGGQGWQESSWGPEVAIFRRKG